MPNCSPESTLIPSSLKKLAYAPMNKNGKFRFPQNHCEALIIQVHLYLLIFSCPVYTGWKVTLPISLESKLLCKYEVKDDCDCGTLLIGVVVHYLGDIFLVMTYL